MGLYKTEGIVLRSKKYGESHNILSIYTSTEGKVSAIAKGVRKLKSRMRGGVQPFTHAYFMLYNGRGSLDTVTGCEVRDTFNPIRQDLVRYAYGAYVLELLDCLVPDRETNQDLFILLLTTLYLLTTLDPEIVVRAYEIRLLSRLGYRPELKCCVNCKAVVHGRQLYFSTALGGLLCQKCRQIDPQGSLVQAGLIATLVQLSTIDHRRLERIQIAPPLRNQLGQLLMEYIEYHLEQRLKSREFLENIKAIEASRA